MKFDIMSLPEPDLDELVGLFMANFEVAPGPYGTLLDVCVLAQIRQAKPRSWRPEPPEEIALQFGDKSELRSAVRHLDAYLLAAERDGEFPDAVEFVRAALADLLDLLAADVEPNQMIERQIFTFRSGT
jgi:hypothetical protein